MVVLCELCGSTPAKVHCDSDRANLCWKCDAAVHGANFLVAKHCRTVLCHGCQSHTPWKATGSKLPPSLSLCVSCSSPAATAKLPLPDRQRAAEKVDRELTSTAAVADDVDDDDDDDDDDDMQGDGYVSYSEDDDDGDNQVVPCTPKTRRISEEQFNDDDDDDDGDGEKEEEEEERRVMLPGYRIKRKWEMAFPHSSDRLIRLSI